LKLVQEEEFKTNQKLLCVICVSTVSMVMFVKDATIYL